TVLTGMRAPSDNPNTVAAIPMEEAPGVKVQVLEHRNIDDALELTGSVAPWQEVTLSAEVTGQIEAFEVEEGAAVTEGQLICRMDTALLNARLEELQAQATLAKQ